MDKKRNSTRILVVAVIAAALSAAVAFGVLNASPSMAQQQSKGSGSYNEQHGSHAPVFAANDKTNNTKVTELRLALRDLWVDHVVWTRQYIVAAAAGAPDADAAAQRLLKNQEDIGNAIKPFYGEQAGDKLTLLLKDHILIAVDLLNAAKAGNSTGAQDAEQRWYDNADQIATFLSNANPNWPKEHMVQMLDNHLSLTKGEAVDRLTGNYTADVAAFDEIHRQAMVMADELADGIVKQFHDQFEVKIGA